MKPLQHAKISAHKHGGEWKDYIEIHEFFDQTKAHVPDMRHRAILHNAFGIYLCKQVFGEVRVNSAGREFSVRDIGEDHCLDDLGTIPTIHEVINCISTEHLKWLGGLPRKKRVIKMGSQKVDVVEATTNVQEATLEDLQNETKKLKEPETCDKCGHISPPGTHPSLMRHFETCPVLIEAAKQPPPTMPTIGPNRDMVIDGATNHFRNWRKRSGLID